METCGGRRPAFAKPGCRPADFQLYRDEYDVDL